MAITRSAAIAKVRQRTRDTVATYQYADTLLVDLLGAALREMEAEIRQDDPTYFYTRKIVLAYTDALDAGTYEDYPLPSNMASLRWIERADLSLRPRLWEYNARQAEMGRFGGVRMHGTLSFDGGVTRTSLPGVGAIETVSVYGDRFKVLPAPTAAGATYGVVYDRTVKVPEGDNEYLDVPAIFEEPVILSTAIRALRLDNDPAASALNIQLYGDGQREEGDLARAKRSIANRTRRDLVLHPH